MIRMFSLLFAAAALWACDAFNNDLVFPETFQWGAATAAHQIEGNNTNNNWYQFETLAKFKGKTRDVSGVAADSYVRFEEDVALAKGLGLNANRISIEWSRVEPKRDQWDEEAIAHYGAVIDAIVAAGMRPMITLHHFTDPIWVNDLSKSGDCDKSEGQPVDDTNLCGWSNSEVRDEWVEFAAEMAKHFGDRVDDWITFNEPVGVLVSGYMYGVFPPGKTLVPFEKLGLKVLRQMIDAHAGAYDAIHQADQIDADHDGKNAMVGFSQAVGLYVPADPNNGEHQLAARQAEYFLNFHFVDALIKGGLDTNIDEVIDEAHPSWKGKLDYLGLQYYFRAPTSYFPLVKPFVFAPCLGQIDALLPGAGEMLGCPKVSPENLTTMGYEHFPQGIYELGKAFSERYAGLPLVITENGIATGNGKRRAQSLVRHLEWLHRLIEEDVDLRGYYHWSLLDNFEWAEGFSQSFGLHTVDYNTLERKANEGADAYQKILRAGGRISQELREDYGGNTPMADESPAHD
jgi:beta-glucosidase